MTARAYYNEHDKYAAAWLRNLITAGEIAPGDVDERSIEDVTPADLAGYTQCHFFAGIGGWSLAARRAGWPDHRPLWTGSCPCQPFSAAGKGAGFADERHLWPAWHWLIQQCRPDEIRGEQVAQGGGLEWFDLVATDLEREGYAVAASDIPAAGFGGWHIRQRLYFAAIELEHPTSDGRQQRRPEPSGWSAPSRREPERLADADAAGSLPGAHPGIHRGEEGSGSRDVKPERPGDAVGLADPSGQSRQQNPRSASPHEAENGREGWNRGQSPSDHGHPSDGQDSVVWLPCRDGKYRPTEPGLFPLAHGVSGRVGRLRAYGNAIHIPTAEAWMRATS